jgi:hypothetical protein
MLFPISQAQKPTTNMTSDAANNLCHLVKACLSNRDSEAFPHIPQSPRIRRGQPRLETIIISSGRIAQQTAANDLFDPKLIVRTDRVCISYWNR